MMHTYQPSCIQTSKIQFDLYHIQEPAFSNMSYPTCQEDENENQTNRDLFSIQYWSDDDYRRTKYHLYLRSYEPANLMLSIKEVTPYDGQAVMDIVLSTQFQ